MKLASILWAGLLALSAPALAQITVEPVAAGTPSATQYRSSLYCEDVYIQKSGNAWAVVPGNKDSLADPAVEKLRACLGHVRNEKRINAVVFSPAIEDSCTTETRCEVSANNRIAVGCHPIFQKPFYLNRTPRSNGYYACNSNFAGRGMLGGMDFDDPIKTELLAEALKGEPLKSAATALVQSRYRQILGIALKQPADACASCREEREAIGFLFAQFDQQTSQADLQAAALNYLKLSGLRKLPEWANERLAPEVVASIEARGAEVWRNRYADQVRLIAAPGASLEALRTFVGRYTNPDPLTWTRTDLDNRVPATQQRIEHIVATQQAAAEAQAQELRQAALRRLAEWRKTLAVGSDTFCGTVIELRRPMVKLAVNAQLQGYANESWLKIAEVFPPEQGCRNVNGRLSTLR